MVAIVKLVALVGAAAILLGGCGEDQQACTTIAAAGLNVTVTDAATGGRICDATVIANNGVADETLQPMGPGSAECGYAGAWERDGTYTVTASRSGYQAAQRSDVVVVKGECHVQAATVTLELAPL